MSDFASRIMKIIKNYLTLSFLLLALLILSRCKHEEVYLPVLITEPARSVKATVAILGGQIASDGGAEITERGICWSTETEPDNSDSKTPIGKGTGVFKCQLTGLHPNTLYHARAYATNSKGTSYGGEVNFTTAVADPPVISTLIDPTLIYYYDAVVAVNIISDGGAPVTERGVCWGTAENPTLLNSEKSTKATSNVTESNTFWCTVNPLNPNTIYHVRAFAINDVDTAYGEVKSITTPPEPIITTSPASEITDISATAGGSVSQITVAFNIEIGICYGTEAYPTINGLHITSGTIEPGDFTCNLTGLVSGTTYHIRAFASWIHNVNQSFIDYSIYGDDQTFTTK